MRRRDTFTFKVSDDERRMIAALSHRLERSQSDAVRLLIREAVKGLEAQPSDWRNAREGVQNARA